MLKISAAAFTLVVMSYQGFAMSHSTAISIWNSAIMPVSSLLYSLTIGVAVTTVMLPNAQAMSLAGTQLMLFLGLGGMHLMFLHGGWHGCPGVKTSVELLLQTLYARWYWGLVIAVGIILPALLLWALPGGDCCRSVYIGGVYGLANTDFQDRGLRTHHEYEPLSYGRLICRNCRGTRKSRTGSLRPLLRRPAP